MTDKTTEALTLAEEALDELRYANDTDIAKTKYYKALAAIREALADHIADTGKVIPQFIPVGIVNDHHSITWIEEIVEDQAPIGAILYALQDSVGRNVSFAKEQK